MRILDNLTLRIYFFICLLLSAFPAWAQNDDDDFDRRSRRAADIADAFGMNEGADYQTFSFSVLDVLWVVLVVAACYVFGKIWRGCTYLILFVAALLFYFSR